MSRILTSLFVLLISQVALGQQYPSVLADLRNNNDAVELQINDLQQQQVDLQFNFPLYDQEFNKAWVTYTGVINFQDQVNGGQFCCNGLDLENQAVEDALLNGQYDYLDYSIMGLWTDLEVEYNANPWFLSNNTSATFGWYDIPEFGGYRNNLNSFEVKIFDDGDIKFRFDKVEIKNHDVTVAVTGDVSEGDYAQFKFKSFTNDGWVSDVPKVWKFNTQTGVFEDQYGATTLYETSSSNNYEDPCEKDPESCGYYDPTKDFLGYDDGMFSDNPFDYVDSAEDSFKEYQESLTLGPVAQDFFEDKYEEDPSFFGYKPDYGYEEDLFDGQPPMDDFGELPDDFSQPPMDDFGQPPMDNFVDDFKDEFSEPMNDFKEPSIDEMKEMVANELQQKEEQFNDFIEKNDFQPESFEDIQKAYEEFAPELDEEEFFPEITDDVYFEEEITLVADVMSKNEEKLLMTEPVKEEFIEVSAVVSQVKAPTTRINAARRVDAVSIAMNQVETSSELLQTALTANGQLTQGAYAQTSQSDNIVSQSSQSTGDVNYENQNSSFSQSVDTQSEFGVIAVTEESILENLLDQNSGSDSGSMDYSMGDTGQTFSSGNTSFESEATLDFTFGSSPEIFVATTIDSGQPEIQQEFVDTSTQTTTTADQDFGNQTDQAFSTGASISTALTSTAPPDFSRFNVAPPTQQEQQTTQRADAQANNMSDEQLEQNLDEFSADMKDSGGFTDQSLTVFLMGRNSAFSQYSNVQLQDNPFYNDKGMPGGSIQNDRRGMLRLVGTDNKHDALVSLQYK